MRSLFCAAALACLCSVSHAERIIVTSASATYFTAAGEVEFTLTFNAPPDLSEEFLAFSGTLAPRSPAWNDYETFGFHNDPRPDRRDGTLMIEHSDFKGESQVTRMMGQMRYDLIDRTLIARATLPELGIGSPVFDFIVGTPDNIEGILGRSATNQRVIYTPEPSSIALMSLGFVGLLAHRLYSRRTPRAR